jgi:hypothetical protein
MAFVYKKIIIYAWVPPMLTYMWDPRIKPISILKNNWNSKLFPVWNRVLKNIQNRPLILQVLTRSYWLLVFYSPFLRMFNNPPPHKERGRERVIKRGLNLTKLIEWGQSCHLTTTKWPNHIRLNRPTLNTDKIQNPAKTSYKPITRQTLGRWPLSPLSLFVLLAR